MSYVSYGLSSFNGGIQKITKENYICISILWTDVVASCRKVQKSDFQNQFPMTKIMGIFRKKVSLKNIMLTAVCFETCAMPVPTKSWNPTICAWGDPFHSYLTHF